MKKLLLVGCAVLSLATGTAHAGWDFECARAFGAYGEYDSRLLNVRAKPSIQSKILGKIEQGYVLLLDLKVRKTKDWAFVFKVMGGEKKFPESWGWVSKQYLKSIDCEGHIDNPFSARLRLLDFTGTPVVPNLPTIGDQK